MTIVTAIYKNEPVSVLDVWEAGGRKIALIQSQDGTTAQRWTHGGWAEDNTRTVPAGLLHPAPEPIGERILRLEPRLRRICGAQVGTFSEHTAEDLFQHVCLMILENASQFENKPDQYLFNFAVWRARNLAAKGRTYTRYIDDEDFVEGRREPRRQVRKTLYTGEPTPEHACISNEIVDTIVEVLESLEGSARQVVQLLIAGHNGAEIACALKISRQAVSQHRQRVARRVELALGVE
jgi:RNA polymerase sigma factor (sigma-70 family)